MFGLNVDSCMARFRGARHQVLLLAVVIMLLAQPLTHGALAGLILYDLMLALVLLGAFAVVFQRMRERFASLAIVVPAIVGNWATYGLTDQSQFVCAVIHHAATIAFTGFTVTVILRGVFKQKVIRTDDVAGVICGYLLAGVAWGHCYLLAELVVPGSFSVNREIAWQLNDVHSRGFFFNCYSFGALTTSGYDDITPIRPFVSSLSWLEAMFGQFYLAVVVAQLVGLKLAQATSKPASVHDPASMSPTLSFPSNAPVASLHRPHLPSPRGLKEA
jgi:voltage-gated potassium channel